MKKLAKSEKINAYTYAMLNELDNNDGDYWCVCDSLQSYANGGERIFCWTDQCGTDDFKEFFNQEPEQLFNNGVGMWYAKYDPERLKAIEEAIRLTELLPD